jgi:hypothetical protein
MDITEYYIKDYLSNLSIYGNTDYNIFKKHKTIIESHILKNHIELVSKTLKEKNYSREFVIINFEKWIAYQITTSNLASRGEVFLTEPDFELKTEIDRELENAYLQLKDEEIKNGVYLGFKLKENRLIFNVINKVTTTLLGTNYFLTEVNINHKPHDADKLKLDFFLFFLKTKILQKYQFEKELTSRSFRVNYDFIGFTKSHFDFIKNKGKLIEIKSTLELVQQSEFSRFSNYKDNCYAIISETKVSCYCKLVDGKQGYFTAEKIKEIQDYEKSKYEDNNDYRGDFREDYNTAFEIDNNEFDGWYEPID